MVHCHRIRVEKRAKKKAKATEPRKRQKEVQTMVIGVQKHVNGVVLFCVGCLKIKVHEKVKS